MSSIKFAIAFSGLLAAASSSARALEVHDQTPPGITVRVTAYGPVFAYKTGAPLYKRTNDSPGISRCNNDMITEYRTGGSNLLPMPAPELKQTCQDVTPPVLAPADAKPFGDWSVIKRDDGTRQWAYKKNPLYSSATDTDVLVSDSSRGAASLVVAPKSFIGLPAEIAFEKTDIGLALVNAKGETLYSFKNPKATCQGACEKKWRPVVAPIAARNTSGADSDWSVASANGAKQWLYKSKPLYTYVGDEQTGDVYGNGVDGAEAILLWKLGALPPAITVQESMVGRVYADAKGMTAYSLYCFQPTGDVYILPCDRPGDIDVFVKGLCGGEQGHCTDLFKPIVAPPGSASPNPEMWSIVRIDPDHPTHVVPEGGGVSVWALEGRPLWTFVGDSRRMGDSKAGDLEGTKLMFWFVSVTRWRYAPFYGNRVRTLN